MRLLLVGEHVLLLQGLTKLLQDQMGTDVRATVRSEEAVALAREWQPDVLIVETSNVPTASGLISLVHEAASELPVLVIAPDDREQFLAAVRAGARGFLGRQASGSELMGCIHAVQRGEWGLPRNRIGDLAQEYLILLTTAQPSAHVQLSPREQRILRLMAQGLSAQRIGRELYLSESTVRADIRTLTQKLGAQNRMQAVTEALRRGLIVQE